MRANNAHEALGHDAIQRRNKIVRFDAHVDEAANHISNIVRMNRSEHEVTGKR